MKIQTGQNTNNVEPPVRGRLFVSEPRNEGMNCE